MEKNPEAPEAKSSFDGNVIYQIYPRSFYDSNNDGIGDIAGITAKLDYLRDLGVDAVWLSPFFTSPMADFGYDVADYRDVDPIFGDLSDFNHMLGEAHRRGIKVIIDFVINHTSSEHAWFKESRSSLDNPKRHWYTWSEPGPNGELPNNWLSLFGGPAWTLDETTGQYYLHSFLKDQPDINWRNPEVRAEIMETARFWLNKGVDGFRLDAVYWIAKNEQLLDDPYNPLYKVSTDDPYLKYLHVNSRRDELLFPYLAELSATVGEYKDRFIVAEAYPEVPQSVEAYEEFYGNVDPKHLAPFNFEPIKMPWDAAVFKKYIDAFQGALGDTDVPVYAYGNHDSKRIASRIGTDAARAMAVLQLTLPGISFIYYGEELGLRNVAIPKNRIQDPFEKNVPGLGLGRDAVRTPMPWSNDANAGFSKAEPWLPINRDSRTVNVSSQAQDGRSMLNLYKELIKLRSSMDALRLGGYEAYDSGNERLFGYYRVCDHHRVLVLINFSNQAQAISVSGNVLFSSEASWKHNQLAPYEGRLIHP